MSSNLRDSPVVYRATYTFEVELTAEDLEKLLTDEPKNIPSICSNSVTLDLKTDQSTPEIWEHSFLFCKANQAIESLFRFSIFAAVRIRFEQLRLGIDGDRSHIRALSRRLTYGFQAMLSSCAPRITATEKKKLEKLEKENALRDEEIDEVFRAFDSWTLSGSTKKLDLDKHLFREKSDNFYDKRRKKLIRLGLDQKSLFHYADLLRRDIARSDEEQNDR